LKAPSGTFRLAPNVRTWAEARRLRWSGVDDPAISKAADAGVPTALLDPNLEVLVQFSLARSAWARASASAVWCCCASSWHTWRLSCRACTVAVVSLRSAASARPVSAGSARALPSPGAGRKGPYPDCVTFIAPSHLRVRWPSCYAHTTRAPARRTQTQGPTGTGQTPLSRAKLPHLLG
jgi:hypothetical protein